MNAEGVRRWWRHHRAAGTISWSMVTLVVGLALLGVMGLAPGPSGGEAGKGVATVSPGLLVVEPAARGEATLGDGWTVGINNSGLRVARLDWVFLDTVTRGSLVTAFRGSVSGHDERIDETRSTVRVSSVVVGAKGATWTGTVSGPGGSWPLQIHAGRVGTQVNISFDVAGSDGMSVNLDVRANTVGVAPAMPARNLRLRAWWATGSSPDLFTNVLMGQTSLDAGGAARAVDLRQNGILVIHGWSPRVVLTVTGLPSEVSHWGDG